VPTAARRVVLAANSSWNIVNFRAGLIRRLKSEGYEPVVLAPCDPALEARMRNLDVEWVGVDIERSGLNPFSDVALLLRYRKILKRLRPCAFLGFTIKPNIYGSIAAHGLGIPVIANISGLGTVFIGRGLLLALVSGLYRFALGRAAVVFFQNPDDRALFVERRLVPPEEARLLPGSGVDLQRFSLTPLPEGPVTFLFIGRILGDKGVRELAEAARSLSRQHLQVRIQLLGPIDEDNRTSIALAEVERWVGEGVIEYLGETDDVRPFIEKATAVVLPSYREGLPRSLLEAGAMGRPLIATDVPGCREVVEDGVNGLLCAVQDSASLAQCIKRIAEMSGEERAAMGSASRRKVETKFSEDVVIGAYLDALGKLCTPGS
jgi:glycosyltransferase involved in cell wall biosynthesis